MGGVLKQRNLLGIRGMSAEEINHILDTAETFREISERASGDRYCPFCSHKERAAEAALLKWSKEMP